MQLVQSGTGEGAVNDPGADRAVSIDAAVLEKLIDGVFACDADWRFVYINASGEKILGVRSEEILGCSHWDVFPLTLGTPLEEEYRRAAAGEVRDFENHYEPWDRWFHNRCFPRPGGGISVWFEDITDRKRTERALRDSELFHRQVLESIPGMVFTTRPDGYCDYQSQQWAEYTGVPVSEHMGDGWNRLLHPDDRSKAMAAWGEAVAGNAPYDLEYRVRRRDGQYEWFKVRGRPILDGEGRIVRWFGVATNVHALVEAEQALRLSEQRFHLAAQAAQLGAYFRDLATGNDYWSPEFLAIYGLQSGDPLALKERIPAAVHPDDFPAVLAEAKARFERRCGPEFNSEHRIIRPDGKVRWVQVRGRVEFDADGRPLSTCGLAMDITGRKRAEESLREAKEQLEQRVAERTAELQKRADQLARMTSELTLAEQRERRRLAQVLHDHLQQLLVGAKFGLETIQRRTDGEVREAVVQVDGLIDESIKASRTLTVELSPPILHEAGLAAGLEWLARWMHEKHGLEVALNIDPTASTDREDVRVLLFQAVRELLFNVTKHAHVTRAAVDLTTDEAGQLCVTVQDEGRGFDPVALRAGDRVQGGFGLFSIQERLGLLGGRLEIDSRPGHGATFMLVAPATRHDPQEADSSRDAAEDGPGQLLRGALAASAARGAAGPIRVLLVDDHHVVRQGLRSVLESDPRLTVVGEAADGLEAIEQARALEPQVVLMDFSMPRLDGVEATRRLRAEMPHIQVIGLSMYEERDRSAAMLEAGAAAYLTKSGKTDRLIDTIRRVSDSGKVCS